MGRRAGSDMLSSHGGWFSHSKGARELHVQRPGAGRAAGRGSPLPAGSQPCLNASAEKGGWSRQPSSRWIPALSNAGSCSSSPALPNASSHCTNNQAARYRATSWARTAANWSAETHSGRRNCRVRSCGGACCSRACSRSVAAMYSRQRVGLQELVLIRSRRVRVSHHL